jgi:hypothetical protein
MKGMLKRHPFWCGANSRKCERRVAARIEAEPKGPGIGHVVTNIAGGSAERLYETMYCARGQLGNFIKLHRLHKNQLLSDRTRCRSPTRYGSCCALPPTGFC